VTEGPKTDDSERLWTRAGIRFVVQRCGERCGRPAGDTVTAEWGRGLANGLARD